MLVLLADLLTSQLLRDPVLDLTFSRTCSPVLFCAGDHAKSFDRIALAIPCQPSALWENNLQGFDDQLHPGVFFDRQQGDDFGACSHDDCDGGSGGGIHG